MDPKNRNRFVRLHAWYVSADGKRQFAVVAKTGRMMPDDAPGSGGALMYRTTDVSLLEVLKSEPINHDVDKFWQLVDDGKLVEFLPGMSLEQLQTDYQQALQTFQPITHSQAA